MLIIREYVACRGPHLLALQLKPSLLARFESAGASTLPFRFNPADATRMQGVLTTPLFVCLTPLGTGQLSQPLDQKTGQLFVIIQTYSDR